jgi:alkylated DNA repair dioxygenase AlkB
VDFQATLFSAPETAGALAGLGDQVHRVGLTRGAWVDLRPGWVRNADDVLETMLREVSWQAEHRPMYDRVVEVPRLVAHYGDREPLPHPTLAAARDALTSHYRAELGEQFVTAGCCYYRDGRDSVAWHGDRIGRGRSADTMVAIVSLGDPRRLALRPRGGGASTGFTMGHGDLLVMGGSCQRTWDHSVPKTAHAGPRVSVQFRPRHVF